MWSGLFQSPSGDRSRRGPLVIPLAEALVYLVYGASNCRWRAQMAESTPLPGCADFDQSDPRRYRPARARHAALVLSNAAAVRPDRTYASRALGAFRYCSRNRRVDRSSRRSDPAGTLYPASNAIADQPSPFARSSGRKPREAADVGDIVEAGNHLA